MSALIEEFKREHTEIIATLNEVKELGILTRKGQAKLKSVKTSLLAHLKKEDDKFYPALCKEAKNNKQLVSALDLFGTDMENVSSVALEFFDKYSFDKYSEGELGTKFVGEFERLFAVLEERIKNEENVLYEVYEKMDQQ